MTRFTFENLKSVLKCYTAFVFMADRFGFNIRCCDYIKFIWTLQFEKFIVGVRGTAEAAAAHRGRSVADLADWSEA